MTKNKVIIILVSFFIVTACNFKKNQLKNSLNSMELLKIPENDWNNLALQKIYFGHQSVGNNLLDGIKVHMTENPGINLNIINGVDLENYAKPFFTHEEIGKNGDPKSKIDHFCNTLDNGMGNNASIAGFKFCYADFNSTTDVQNVFEYYRSKIDQMIKKYPNLKIVHFTVPIRTLQGGTKGMIKKFMGKDIGIMDNAARQQFNEQLQKQYNEQLIFDIAKYESTLPDGNRNYSIVDDKKVYSMVQGYSYDGGHLSAEGKYWISAQFLEFLTKVSK